MKLKAFAASAAIILTLSTLPSFALPNAPKDNEKPKDNEIHQQKPKENENPFPWEKPKDNKKPFDKHKKDGQEAEKDPIKVLENKKQEVLKLLKDGKITKEKADRIIEKIDSRIAEIKEFQKLPLEKKREKIINDFKVHLDEMVKNGKMKKEEAEKMMKEIIEKINNWDGTGYPMIHNKEKHNR